MGCESLKRRQSRKTCILQGVRTHATPNHNLIGFAAYQNKARVGPDVVCLLPSKSCHESLSAKFEWHRARGTIVGDATLTMWRRTGIKMVTDIEVSTLYYRTELGRQRWQHG